MSWECFEKFARYLYLSQSRKIDTQIDKPVADLARVAAKF